jgi:NitT/TauT family transport system ATP-binding protein
MPNITLRKIQHCFDQDGDELLVLKDISFDVRDGEFIAIVGPSGCGKTTLLRIISGLLKPTSGSVEIDGQSPNRIQDSGKISFMFQSDTLLPWRNVFENIALPFELSNKPRHSDDEINSLISLVHLEGSQKKFPAELSGGMRSRAALARSIALSPSLLLLDEPFGSLDEETSRDLNIELYNIWKKKKPTVLLVTHNIEHAVFVAQKVYIFSKHPGEIHGCIQVPLPALRDRETGFSHDFFDCVSSVRRALQEAYE